MIGNRGFGIWNWGLGIGDFRSQIVPQGPLILPKVNPKTPLGDLSTSKRGPEDPPLGPEDLPMGLQIPPESSLETTWGPLWAPIDRLWGPSE